MLDSLYALNVDSYAPLFRLCSISSPAVANEYSNASVLSDSRADREDFDLLDKLQQKAMLLFGVTLLTLAFGYVQIILWTLTAERQAKRIRIGLFSSIVKQDISWFDTYKTRELNSRLVT